MPGIIGLFSNKKIHSNRLNGMIDSVKHEKWYKTDKYSSDNFAVGRVHLGIFNPQPQPIFNRDKTLCIFMDGKVYDYQKEKEGLIEKGYEFKVNNDAEFCLYLFEEKGVDFVKELNGSFVISIVDIKNKKLYLFNDRYGLRLHYYTIVNHELIFAPNARAILVNKHINKELDDEAVAEFFSFGEFFGDKTFFDGIKILPPASILTYDGRESHIREYWHWDYNPDYTLSEEKIVEMLIDAFKNAVKVRIEDGPKYGVSLSGGLDSRTVLAAIDNKKNSNTLAFSFGPRDCGEVMIAREVTKKTGTKHLLFDISPEFMINNAEKEVEISEGRDFVGVSFLYPIHKSLKNKIDVVLDGFSQDLILGGSYLKKKIISCKNDEFLFNILLNRSNRLFKIDELPELLTPRYYNKIKGVPMDSFKTQFGRIVSQHPANKSDEFSLMTHVAWIPIAYTLMRETVETSHPTVDNKFIDIILGIPPELRQKHYIYRKFLKKLSPELAKIPYDNTLLRVDTPTLFWRLGRNLQIGKVKIKRLIWRLSKGKIFLKDKRSHVNYNEWFRTNKEWKEYFERLLLSKNTLSKKYVSQEYVKRLYYESTSGKKDNSLKIIYLATFELFLRLFFSEDSPS